MASPRHSCYFRAWKSPSPQNKCKSLLLHVETLGAGPGGACLAAPSSLSLYRPLQGSQQMAWGRFPGSPGKSTFQKLCVFCLITLTNIHFLYLCRFFLKFFLKCNQNTRIILMTFLVSAAGFFESVLSQCIPTLIFSDFSPLCYIGITFLKLIGRL